MPGAMGRVTIRELLPSPTRIGIDEGGMLCTHPPPCPPMRVATPCAYRAPLLRVSCLPFSATSLEFALLSSSFSVLFSIYYSA